MVNLPYRREPCHGETIPGEAALSIDSLVVTMPGDEQPALADISLSVPIGSRIALVGPNGAGKSTLLKSVIGLLKPRSGEVRVFGMPVGSCLHAVAYLPQRGEIDWQFPITVRTLIGTGRYVHLGWLRRLTPDDHQRIQHEIERLKLSDLADRQIGQLSGGQQQRALLARALVQGADLLLLDEPMTAIDAETRGILTQVLDDLRAVGKTVIIATHDIDRIESDYDVIVYFADGRQVSAAEATQAGHIHA